MTTNPRRLGRGYWPGAVPLGALVACAAASGSGALATGGRPGFVDVVPSVGILHSTRSGGPNKTHIRETLGQGVCWTDFDGDGDPDLFVPNGGREVRPHYEGAEGLLEPWRFYENRQGRFEEASAKVGLAVRAWGLGCAAGDVDGDGFDDLFVTTAAAPNRLFHNRGDGAFEDWTKRAGLGDDALSTSAAFGDLDGDGDLDLFVARYLDESKPPPATGCRWKGHPVLCGPKGFPPLDAVLYLNRGDGTFREASRQAGVAGHAGYGLGVVLLDADADGDADVYVANDSSPSHLFLNRGRAVFEEAAMTAGVALSDGAAVQAGMGVDAGDLDGDGHIDLVKTNFSDDVDNFYRSDGNGFFSEWSHRSGLAAASFPRLGWSVLLEDFDLDADLDVFVANGHVYPGVERFDPGTSYRQTMQLLFNDGRGRLREEAAILGPVFLQGIAARGAAAADFDRDGDMDLAVTRDGEPPLLLRNDLPGPAARWVKVRLRGRGRNLQGIGARVTLEAAGRQQVREMRRSRGYLSSGEAVMAFGLGRASQVDRLTIRWPSGRTQTLRGLATNTEWIIAEGRMARVADTARF